MSSGTDESEPPDLETLVGLLDEEYVREILVAIASEPKSASELSEACDAPLSTVCRKLDRMTESNVVTEHTRVRPDGHHDSVYAPAMEAITLELTAEGFELDVVRPDETDPADRLRSLWGDL